MYQPKNGEPCGCKRGVQRDNCPACEGTGQRIDFAAIRRHNSQRERAAIEDQQAETGGVTFDGEASIS